MDDHDMCQFERNSIVKNKQFLNSVIAKYPRDLSVASYQLFADAIRGRSK